MSFSKFVFSFPTREEINSVLEVAESNPEELDGREMWIFREFLGGDLNE